jgi:2-polyprenyl-3-methyl-5-hydroxy-6-metoxy-1,4-benzoquinol methylase
MHVCSSALDRRRPFWNRNIHYHDDVLAVVPPDCRRALDVGCGDGMLAGELAGRCDEVVGIDVDAPTIARARARFHRPNLKFVEADVMSHAFEPASFDVIASIATLHHLPLEPALERFSELLRPGGVISVIGLYRLRTLVDFSYGCAAIPMSWWWRLTRTYEEVAAPIRDPEQTLQEIARSVDRVLPGATLERRLLFRYLLVWRKP